MVLRDTHSLEWDASQRREVRRIYKYLSYHPEHPIHQQWANRDRPDPEVEERIKDFHAGLRRLFYLIARGHSTTSLNTKGKKT